MHGCGKKTRYHSLSETEVGEVCDYMERAAAFPLRKRAPWRMSDLARRFKVDVPTIQRIKENRYRVGNERFPLFNSSNSESC